VTGPTPFQPGSAAHSSRQGLVIGAERVKAGGLAPILGMGATAGACAAAGECVSLDDELSDGLQSCEGT
jgi:hypothetical protein